MEKSANGGLSLGLRVLLPGAMNALAERTRGGRYDEAAQRVFDSCAPELKRHDLVRLGEVLERLAALCRTEGNRRVAAGED